MINYKVKRGDSLSYIAYQYQTTVQSILSLNPSISDPDLIQIGMTLKIEPSEEYAKRKAKKAKASKQSTSSSGGSSASWQSGGSGGPIGILTMNSTQPLYEITPSGNLSELRRLPKNGRYKVYNRTDRHGGLYNVGGNQWIPTDANVTYTSTDSSGTSASTDAAADTSGALSSIGNVPTQDGPRSSDIKFPNADPIHLEKPDYRRPIFQFKKPDGDSINVELRIISVNGNSGNNIQANQTNSGHLVNVAGHALTRLNIRAEFFDTKTNKEFNDFYSIYQRYIKAGKNDNYYSMRLSKFFYKNREYKGLIQQMNYSDTAQKMLTNSLTISFLVLQEKLTTITAMNRIPTVVGSSGTSEGFYSSLNNMLTNPVTGQLYGSDD